MRHKHDFGGLHARLPEADGYGISGNARSARLDTVVFWGTMDDVRWRNGQYQRKKAYYCVKDTVADHGYDDRVTVIAPT